MATNLNPGPLDDSLLRLQDYHISGPVWGGYEDRILTVRRVFDSRDPGQALIGQDGIPWQIIPYLREAGFFEVAMMNNIPSHAMLISALVERWRPETHTFHLPVGECTVTLEDVAILLGLRVDGEPVIGRTSIGAQDWRDIIGHLLGKRPPNKDIKGNRLRMGWLNENFNDINAGQGEVWYVQYARAYIMRLIGGLLFCDLSGAKVPLRYLILLQDMRQAGRLSWGSAVLSYLYRQLCLATNPEKKDIGGCTTLLQLWAWVRIRGLSPDAAEHPLVAGRPLGAR